MSGLSPTTVQLDWGPEGADRVLLWQSLTGRGVVLARARLASLAAEPSNPTLRPLVRRLEDLGMLGAEVVIDHLIPCPVAWTLLLPETRCLWSALPLERTAGGFPFREIPLDEVEQRVWRACNGARTVTQVAARARAPIDRVRGFLGRLTALEVQALQLRRRPPRGHDQGTLRLTAPPRPRGVRLGHQVDGDGSTQLERWHRDCIVSGAGHFDDVESTVAHAFARPHPALGGRPFGGALYDALSSHGMVPDQGDVVEVGPGTGELARAFLDASPAGWGTARRYTRVDLSPALLEAQARQVPETHGVQGSATALPFPDGTVDLLLSNEVLADLDAVVREGERAPEVEARLDRYGLPLLSPGARYNLGAWQLVEELARVLRPGGAAYLSEFGGLDEVPTETLHLDHPEVSIHFGHLAAVAAGCGLVVEVLPLGALLGMDLHAKWLSRPSYEALRARLRGEGRTLEARAWTAADVDLPWPVVGLRDVPISADGPGPVVTRFWAVLIRKPSSAASQS